MPLAAANGSTTGSREGNVSLSSSWESEASLSPSPTATSVLAAPSQGFSSGRATRKRSVPVSELLRRAGRLIARRPVVFYIAWSTWIFLTVVAERI